MYYKQKQNSNRVSKEDPNVGISQPPVNILFSPLDVSKKDVWSIDVIRILDILIKILSQTDKKDLRVAGIAALSSAMIHRMKVESIFALQKAAMEKKPLTQREDVDIEVINMPYRHESTYPVTLDELLSVLENLIGTIANPRSSRRQLEFEPVQAPNFDDYFISLEKIIGQYEELIVNKIKAAGYGSFKNIVAELELIDVIRCFFAILFLARDMKVDLEQTEDDIIVSLIK
ncbi:Chromosome segregation and condensation protein ScpA [Nitrosotalea sinensis]|jgi:segregation and condensation protein A|uniref:Chromosome segregation and condensation protein ScpA n=1 Tax=Nitrosotalea sinensis TaxID=1499975 RepID=A0A2H1EJG6_9ARCH|nr:Chromosome segregation and condensation protein ScpA [Candidatus Nitrosotalea sinensis]